MKTYIVYLVTAFDEKEEYEFTTLEEAKECMDLWAKDDYFTSVWMEEHVYY